MCRLLSWSRQRRPLVIAAAVCLVALSTFGATRLSFDTDVLSLLPRTGRVIPAFRTFLGQFGSLDELYVVFRAPEGHAIEDYSGEIDAWVQRLRGTPDIARVDTGLVDPSRDLEWLASRQLLLLRDEALGAALSRFHGEGMRAAIASRRELLALPSASVAEVVRHDPLGMYDLLREHLAGAQTGMNIGAAEGGYVTPDSRSRLVIAHPARPPYDTDFSRALLATLDRVRTAMAASRPASSADDDILPPLQVAFAGGHHIAVETEAVVRRESILNTVVSLGLILPLLFLVFRSLWLVVAGPLPAAISLVIVLGILGLAGTTLSAAATASAAMLFGLGVDGVVLLYVVHTLALREGAGANATLDHLRGAATSMLLGMWTTAATFYGLAFVDFPSLQQLGTLIGHSMVLCGLVTLILIPALLPRRIPPRRPPSLNMPALASWVLSHRTAIVAGAALLTVALGAAALQIHVNPTLDRLRSVTPAAAALDRIGLEFGLPRDVFVVLHRGRDLDSLLASDEHLSGVVVAALPSVPMQAASALLPSESAQRSRAEAVRGAALSPDDVAAELARTAAAEGFKQDSFAPFQKRLPQLLATESRLTYDEYLRHGLSDLIGRFVRKDGEEWLLASYVFPSTDTEVAQLERLVSDAGNGVVLTGLPLVNHELAERFLPQFLKGLGIGSLIVVMLIVWTFRDWRLSLLSLAPAVIGLVWAAGLLALARVELDLFAVFAVVTFVGIGVDYGVHLVHRYRERRDAAQAIGELAPVILVAAAITLLGYGTLVTSSYPPLRSIGLVSIVTVLTLAAASLFLLPALLPASTTTLKAAATPAERRTCGHA